MDFKDYFTRGSHGTLRLKNNTQFSYMNPWKQLYTDTIIDEWHVGEIMSAEYTIVVANGINAKETIKAIVIASPEAASIAIIGRASIANNMVNVDVAVNNSTLQAIRKKFLLPKFDEVASIRIEQTAVLRK